jgi:hypothetical protein
VRSSTLSALARMHKIDSSSIDGQRSLACMCVRVHSVIQLQCLLVRDTVLTNLRVLDPVQNASIYLHFQD